MAPKKGRRHIPQRTCIGCRQTADKRSLIRLVRTADGVAPDPSGKMPGRGAYVHDREACWDAALKNSLSKALRVAISDEERAELRQSLAAGGPARERG